MLLFEHEFKTLQYVVRNSKSVLLFAHTRPDPDTIGAVVAFGEYLALQGKLTTIACFDPFPVHLQSLLKAEFRSPDKIDIGSYDVIIACDSVDRGFHSVGSRVLEHQVVVLIDHHPNITLTGDIVIIDSKKSSTCEILYDFFGYSKCELSLAMATALLTGLVFDTGNFQHASTTSRVLDIASDLMRLGAPLSRVVDAVFMGKKVSALKLWGKAFMRAKVFTENGMIVSALTQGDLQECHATAEDVYYVVSILNMVPGTKFSLVIFQRDETTIKGHLRSEEYKGVDVLSIASVFGGGGHRLASGFEIQGRIQETEFGWEVV